MKSDSSGGFGSAEESNGDVLLIDDIKSGDFSEVKMDGLSVQRQEEGCGFSSSPPPLPPKVRKAASAGGPANSVTYMCDTSSLHSLARDPTVQQLTAAERDPVRSQTPDGSCGRRYHISTVTIIAPEADNQLTLNVSAIRLNSESEGCVRISIGGETKPPEDMVHKSEANTNSAYFFNSPFAQNMVMSSGQCSPSDTLDSGTCSDLDGTPPPLPKKKLSKTNSNSQKSISVTLISSNRVISLGSSGDEDNESNISCDSLNSSDLNGNGTEEPIAEVVNGKSLLRNSNALECNGSSTNGFLPKGLLHDIRQRSAKLSTIGVETIVEEKIVNGTDVWGKGSETKVMNFCNDNELTSFKLVSKINAENKKKDEENLTSLPITLEKCLNKSKTSIVNESTYEERKHEQERYKEKNHFSTDFMYETDKYYKFHLNEKVSEEDVVDSKHSVKVKSGQSKNGVVDRDKFDSESLEYFAGYKDYKNDMTPATIRSSKGTIRGVKNRVRAGIATFLQMQNTTVKSYKEKDAGKVVVYTTSMGIVRGTYQRCMQVKKILRTLLIKFEDRDVFMSSDYQDEIRDRMRSEDILVPQLFVDGNHVGDADTVEKLNETGELRRMLKPYRSADACSTCPSCGGYRLLPCPICCGSKKSLHRNDFTTEFVALKCMNCDEVGLVKCGACA